MSASTAPFGRADTALYASGSLGTGVFSTVPSVLLLYFCTEAVHIPAGWAALIVFAPKAWALFWDPFVGAWSDGAATPFGRRRPFLLAGAFGVAAAFLALFSPPALSLAGTTAWVGLSYLALVTLYALFAVPYVALPAEFGSTARLRSQLVGWRMSAAMLGVLAGAGLAPALVQLGHGGRAGYAFMASWIAGGCLVFMLCPLLILRGRDHGLAAAPRRGPKLWAQYGSAARHPALRPLVLAYILLLTATGVLSAATPYLVTKALGRGQADIGAALGVMLIVTTLTAPLMTWLGRRWGEMRMLVLAALGFVLAVAAIGACAWTGAAWPLTLAAFALAGAPFAGLQVFPYTLVAHLVHGQTRSGVASEGALMGMWTAAEKLGLALGPTLTGLGLAMAQGDIAGRLAPFVILVSTGFGLAALPLLSAVARASVAEPQESAP